MLELTVCSLQDIAIDNRDNPRLLQVILKQSKANPFRKGVKLYIGATDSTICPVKAILSYLAIRKRQSDRTTFCNTKGQESY